MATDEIRAFPRELPALIVFDGDTKYTTYGSGLQYGENKEEFRPDITEALKPALIPFPRAPNFWRAQSAFRGGPHASMAIARAWLEEHPNEKMTDELRRLGESSSRRYLVDNHAAREKRWAACKTDDERVAADFERYLEEKLRTNPEGVSDNQETVSTIPQYIILRDSQYGTLAHTASRKYAVQCIRDPESYEQPDNPHDKNRLIIIGRIECREAVDAKYEQLAYLEIDAKKNEKDKRDLIARKHHSEVVRHWEESVQKGERNARDWDVVGRWTIMCPDIEDSCDIEQPLQMTIYSSDTAEGKFMYGTFNFQTVEGVVWFEKPKPGKQIAIARKWHKEALDDAQSCHTFSSTWELTPSPSFLSTLEIEPVQKATKLKRKLDNTADIGPTLEDSDDNSAKKVKTESSTLEDEAAWEDVSSSSKTDMTESDPDPEDEDESEDDLEGYVPEPIFPLGATDNPSPGLHTFPFRWRGIESSTGDPQVFSDDFMENITFGGVGGSELRGTITVAFVGDGDVIEFTGVKIGGLEAANGEKPKIPGIMELWDLSPEDCDSDDGSFY